jgi:hypothetical protein
MRCISIKGFFYFRFCDVANLANHSQEDLTKFGYKLDMKAQKEKFFNVLAYLLEPIVEIWRFFFLKFKI